MVRCYDIGASFGLYKNLKW